METFQPLIAKPTFGFTRRKSVLLFVSQKYKICISYMSITFSQYRMEMGIFKEAGHVLYIEVCFFECKISIEKCPVGDITGLAKQ